MQTTMKRYEHYRDVVITTEGPSSGGPSPPSSPLSLPPSRSRSRAPSTFSGALQRYCRACGVQHCVVAFNGSKTSCRVSTKASAQQADAKKVPLDLWTEFKMNPVDSEALRSTWKQFVGRVEKPAATARIHLTSASTSEAWKRFSFGVARANEGHTADVPRLVL